MPLKLVDSNLLTQFHGGSSFWEMPFNETSLKTLCSSSVISKCLLNTKYRRTRDSSGTVRPAHAVLCITSSLRSHLVEGRDAISKFKLRFLPTAYTIPAVSSPLLMEICPFGSLRLSVSTMMAHCGYCITFQSLGLEPETITLVTSWSLVHFIVLSRDFFASAMRGHCILGRNYCPAQEHVNINQKCKEYRIDPKSDGRYSSGSA